MRVAYFLASYIDFTTLTTPSVEYLDNQMRTHGLDPQTYDPFSTFRIFLLAVLLIGIIIGELKGHRFFIPQTSEESKYPWKPYRCLITLWIMLIVIELYPDYRFWQLIFICSIQRITMNHLYTCRVELMSKRTLMYFVLPYIFGYVFKIIIMWYNIYLAGLLLYTLIKQSIGEKSIIKFVLAFLYTSSYYLFYLAVQNGCDTTLNCALGVYILACFVFFKPYYDFMTPHLKENAKLWKNREYHYWK
ncbi:unnamed protein product [Moneuplotes crassus]|uniref:Uncharacterized protein n=1 Tax=Euplotes crassus TaxID=5936 RepID=A0AAD1XWY5_EUPCR|nr:unnamed protein product [Moneuplotes crassus]